MGGSGKEGTLCFGNSEEEAFGGQYRFPLEVILQGQGAAPSPSQPW